MEESLLLVIGSLLLLIVAIGAIRLFNVRRVAKNRATHEASERLLTEAAIEAKRLGEQRQAAIEKEIADSVTIIDTHEPPRRESEFDYHVEAPRQVSEAAVAPGEAVAADAERKAAEDAARRDAERKAAEDAARRDAERKAAEDAARREAARRDAEREVVEEARRANERQAAEEAAQRAAERTIREQAARQAMLQKAAEESARREAERRSSVESERGATERTTIEQLAARRRSAEDARRDAERLETDRRAIEQVVRGEEDERQAVEKAIAEAKRQQDMAAATPRQPARAKAKLPEETIVMIADDSRVVRVKTSRLLTANQYRVAAAEDGVDAARQIEASPPDVLVTDVDMPGLNGFQLAKMVRDNPRTANLPIIMVTSDNEQLRAEAARIGVNVVLGKPYPEEQLIAHIQQLMNGQISV